MEATIFKAYDIRGIYPEEINELAVLEIAAALAEFFKRGKIVFGHDARLSSPFLYRAAIAGIKNYELKTRGSEKQKTSIIPDSKFITLSCGLVTTPMFYFLVNHFRATGGIMITASHNPKEYNGLKVVGRKAVPISGKEIYKLVISPARRQAGK